MGEDKKQHEIEKEWENIWQESSMTAPEKILSGFLFKNGYQAFERYFEKKRYTLLEVGAGSGRYGLALGRAHPHSLVTVTDPTDSSVDLMSKIKTNLNITNANVRKEDALKLSFSDDTFDYVLADAVIQHIVDYPTAIGEMLRVLKPGGKLIVSTVNTFNPPHLFYKCFLKLFKKQYEYDYENTFSRRELYKAVDVVGVDDVILDGFAVAYGLIRLKRYSSTYAKFGGLLHQCIKFLDKITARWLTRMFGFEIFVVVTKTKVTYEKTS